MSKVKKKQKRNFRRKISVTLVLVMLLAGVLILGNLFSSKIKEKYHGIVNDQAQLGEFREVNADSAVNYPVFNTANLNSLNVFLLKLDSGEIISENNAEQKMYPASLTKIMTAILAIEELPDLDETVVIPEEIFQELYAQNASRAGFEPGEAVTIRDLLYGTMLPSGGECCLSLGDRIAGSEADFVQLMNQKAKEIGMNYTHYCNSTGLHDEDHYSTAKDIAILLQYALKNDDFRTVFTSSSYTTSPTEIHPEGFTFSSTLFKFVADPNVNGGELLGGKTGYTQEAGQCLASLADIDGEEYILITAGANGDSQTEHLHIDDAQTVYNWLGDVVNP